MKTFEERYTAWIDGQLEGGALTAFEQELARRAEAGDAEAAGVDKADALQLRALLKEHLQAPVLTNAEFFNHQMRERIDAECTLAARRREAAARPAFRLPAFAWPFLRIAGVGAACLFVVGALYYGLAPSHPDSGQESGEQHDDRPAGFRRRRRHPGGGQLPCSDARERRPARVRRTTALRKTQHADADTA